jgi:hypothetical protein
MVALVRIIIVILFEIFDCCPGQVMAVGRARLRAGKKVS